MQFRFFPSAAASKVLVLAFGSLVELDILGIYFYQELLQALILLLFGRVRTLAGKISLCSTCSTIFRSGEDNSR